MKKQGIKDDLANTVNRKDDNTGNLKDTFWVIVVIPKRGYRS